MFILRSKLGRVDFSCGRRGNKHFFLDKLLITLVK
ncbi:hypothetical protein DYJ42_00180 [Streptococcus constellatus]|uniref:Uncharacterized protein n=1 Tax=Streptococcus intermedius B196 TaxID=862967 RepID=T1ZDE3_STRIT|nr:hypothetical protein SIR_0055 [Streptococcus intermedius B196]PMR65210.1 hypothetical protein C1I62_08795 [Streptococcus intermedius]RID95136.1 hypothetical protein DYJ42_00180 [Streptococcus constellatus]